MRRLLFIPRLFVAQLSIARLFIPLVITVFLATLFTAVAPPANAQRTALHASHFAPPFHNGAYSRSSFYPLAYADPFYSDYLSIAGYPVASQPPMILLQAHPAPAPDRAPAPVQPLLIELRGDRYVRVSGPEASGAASAAETISQETTARMPDPRSSPRRGTSTQAAATPPPPPAILIFRDGRSEETSDYTIANGILYTHSDFYSTGSWTRKIELSSLNLPETLKSNESRGVRFQLPSFPNEIIVRP